VANSILHSPGGDHSFVPATIRVNSPSVSIPRHILRGNDFLLRCFCSGHQVSGNVKMVIIVIRLPYIIEALPLWNK
jgi:hypothetical protein